MTAPLRLSLPAELEPFGWVAPDADGTWQPTVPDDGLYCCKLQVWGARSELLDVVAWEFGHPSPWWLRWGYANFLGLAAIWRAKVPALNQRVTRLVATPRDWLRDRGESICILNWDAPLLPLLDDLGDVICETPALEAQLRSAIEIETNRHIRIRGAA